MEMISSNFIRRLSKIWGQWDLLVSSNIFFIVRSIGWDVDPISPATEDFIAVKSPTFLISSLLSYIVIIGFGRTRIKRTQRKQDLLKRNPSWLHFFVIIHNIFLILLSLYMCFGCILEARKNKYHVWGNQYKQNLIKLLLVQDQIFIIVLRFTHHSRHKLEYLMGSNFFTLH